MKKIIVIGCPGSGKSTFSRELQGILGLPLYHLDMLYWNPDKTTVDKGVFRDRLEEILGQDKWIVDGNYASTMEMRMQVCDTVIFLDYDRDVCLEGILSRRGQARSDMPWVEEKDQADGAFVRFVTNYQAESRPHVMALLEKYADKRIYIFRHRDEADAFLARLNAHG